MAHRRKRGVTISKKALIAIIIAILLLIIGGVLIGRNWNRWFGGNPFTPDVDPNAGAWQGQQLPNKSGEEAVGIQIPGYPSITIPADTKNVTVAFLNPEDNPCYFTFELVLKDTDEVLYTSKMVPPGQAIYEAELSRPLEKGEYNATIKIKTASLEDGSAMNGADVETVLIVQ